jgi:hypothetical protein
MKSLEDKTVKLLSSQALQGMVKALLASGGFAAKIGGFLSIGAVGSLVSFGFGLVIAVGIKYGDWLGYLLATGWETSSEAKAYEKAAQAVLNLPKGATADAIAKANAAQDAAFDKLINLGTA